MHEQVGARSERLAAGGNGAGRPAPVPACAVLAVVSGEGMRRLYEENSSKGLNADKIHIGARIVAAADVLDALTAPRYYKPPYPLDKTIEMMDGMSGDHLDPRVMKAVHDAMPKLQAKIEELKSTWPKPGEQGMGSISEAASALSQRDQTNVTAGS